MNHALEWKIASFVFFFSTGNFTAGKYPYSCYKYDASNDHSEFFPYVMQALDLSLSNNHLFSSIQLFSPLQRFQQALHCSEKLFKDFIKSIMESLFYVGIHNLNENWHKPVQIKENGWIMMSRSCMNKRLINAEIFCIENYSPIHKSGQKRKPAIFLHDIPLLKMRQSKRW